MAANLSRTATGSFFPSVDDFFGQVIDEHLLLLLLEVAEDLLGVPGEFVGGVGVAAVQVELAAASGLVCVSRLAPQPGGMTTAASTPLSEQVRRILCLTPTGVCNRHLNALLALGGFDEARAAFTAIGVADERRACRCVRGSFKRVAKDQRENRRQHQQQNQDAACPGRYAKIPCTPRWQCSGNRSGEFMREKVVSGGPQWAHSARRGSPASRP